MHHPRIHHLVAALMLVGLITRPCLPQTKDAPERFKRVEYGISGGVLFPGSIWVEMADDNVLNSTSPMFRAFVDVRVAEYFTMGVYANVALITLDHLESYPTLSIPDDYKHATAYEFGAVFKVPLRVAETLELVPGFNVGYRRISSKFVSESFVSYSGTKETTGDVNGLGLNASLELRYLTGGPVTPYLEFGFLAQPTGGNKLTFLTFPPIVYLVGGIVL